MLSVPVSPFFAFFTRFSLSSLSFAQGDEPVQAIGGGGDAAIGEPAAAKAAEL